MESSAIQERQMQLPIVFFQICVTLLLLGVLARKGLILADPAFTAAVAWFWLAPAILWVFAQTAWASKGFEMAYIGCYLVALGLATVVVVRHPDGWHTLVAGFVGMIIPLSLVLDSPSTSPAVIMDSIACPLQLAFALYALTESTKTSAPFTKVELMGMGFFWLGQFIVSGAYVLGTIRGSQPFTITTNLGAGACAVAFLWMAVTFWTGGLGAVETQPHAKDKGEGMEFVAILERKIK